MKMVRAHAVLYYGSINFQQPAHHPRQLSQRLTRPDIYDVGHQRFVHRMHVRTTFVGHHGYGLCKVRVYQNYAKPSTSNGG